MNTIFGTDLSQRLLVLDRIQRHTLLGLSRVSLARNLAHIPSSTQTGLA